MRLISLTQGKFAMVDDRDYEFLMQWKWRAQKGQRTFYACRTIRIGVNKRKCLMMHRLLWGVPDLEMEIDHIDQNGLNNQKYNLRIGTSAQNSMNRIGRGRSKFLGVSADSSSVKRGKIRWIARVTNNKKRIHLGMFDLEIDAAKAYNKAAKIYYGEFANLNRV